MLTASAFAEEREEALNAGADEFMRKPVEQEQLYAVLEQQLDLQFVRRHHGARPAAPRRWRAKTCSALIRPCAQN
jgi:DNA-binding response OmpR family regulator